MIKLLLILGVIVGSGVIGKMGVAGVTTRRTKLKILQKDVLRIGGLITEQGMMFSGALKEISGPFSDIYDFLMEWGTNPEHTGHGLWERLRGFEGFAELAEEDLKLTAVCFSELTECISAGEVNGVVGRFSEEIDRILREVEEHDLKRARTLRTVWVLAGMCAAIFLI